MRWFTRILAATVVAARGPEAERVNTYSQSSGRWYDGIGVIVGIGYSGGNCGNDPEGMNNPEMQELACVGPLPCGVYTLGTPYDHLKCGPYFIPLTPDPANEMFGRGGFGVHGDLVSAPGQHKASDGCVILALDVRIAIWNSGDRDLTVISGASFPDVNGEISV